ncbi:MAG: hypothetical protein ACR2OX_07760 [Methyloligellaceae bacterium]
MTAEMELRAQPPTTLSRARAIAHKAAQLLTKAARANLTAAPDDSHSNLGWDSDGKQFLSQPLPREDNQYFIGLSLAPLGLRLLNDGELAVELTLNNVSYSEASAWLDTRLERVGLNASAAVDLPYDLPPGVEEIAHFIGGDQSETLQALAAWFDFAQSLLSEFAEDKANLTPGPSPVRCWPHHFDIATYVSLEEGEFETARGIGVGMSPGDENYDQPYFYINPWPNLNPDDLPELMEPGHWHREGFVGAIATAEQVLSLNDISGKLPVFVNTAFAVGREKLGV